MGSEGLGCAQAAAAAEKKPLPLNGSAAYVSLAPLGLEEEEEEEEGEGDADATAMSDSWDLADLEESVKRLLAPSITGIDIDMNSYDGFSALQPEPRDLIDPFLEDALRNSKDRLFILRLEQEVIRFMRNPKLQQLEFEPMPSSYLRLAAHRVVQHYNLQSLVVDSNLPKSTRIVARKTLESRFPSLKLSDVPEHCKMETSLPPTKLAIMRRPNGGGCLNKLKDGYTMGDETMVAGLNPPKSVEEREEEYNKARARIFSSEDLAGEASKEEAEPFARSPFETFPRMKVEGDSDCVTARDFALRTKLASGRVAILRDREKDRKDPDYNRNYDRYLQRSDPGLGLNIGLYNMETANHGALVGPQIQNVFGSVCLNQPNVQGPWFNSSCSPMVYGPLDSMMFPFDLGSVARPIPNPGMCINKLAFTYPGSTTARYVYPWDSFHHSMSKPFFQHEASFGQARHRQ